MAFPSNITIPTIFPRLIVQSLYKFLSILVKDFVTYHLLKYGAYLSKPVPDDDEEEEEEEEEEECCPSPLLVTLPVTFMAGSVKDRLPVVELRNSTRFMVKKAGVCCEKIDEVCIVCLRFMKASDEVRELCNCCHVFHRECVDAWIDEGQKTCPLCRSQLLPDQEDGNRCGSDPWRRERMIYLFGEDFDLN